MIKKRMTWRTCSTHHLLVLAASMQHMMALSKNVLSVRPLVCVKRRGRHVQATHDQQRCPRRAASSFGSQWNSYVNSDSLVNTVSNMHNTIHDSHKEAGSICMHIYIFLHASRSKLNLLIKKIGTYCRVQPQLHVMIIHWKMYLKGKKPINRIRPCRLKNEGW
jgi:hypothetical protein